MTSDGLVERLAREVPLATLQQFRPPRSAIVLPLMRALLGTLAGRTVVELGSGEPLLLAKALVGEGAQVTAVDPALADPRVEPGGVRTLAVDLFELPQQALAPAELTLSTLLFGAPLRQRARRHLWPRYLRRDRPTEDEVHAQLREVELALLARLAAWTQPGGWTVHWSLERLFAASAEDWRASGFSPLVLGRPESAPRSDDPQAWARFVLGGMVVAQRAGD